MSNRRLIVFDMDGVLVDVSRSYRETIRQTARLFFKGASGWDKLPDPLFQLSDLAAVKLAGKLNNDWDLSYTVITLLGSTVAISLQHGSDVWDRYSKTVASFDLAPMIQYLQTHRSPLMDLFREKGIPRSDVLHDFYKGDVGTGNVIKQIFQEIYLGREQFRANHGIKPQISRGNGYIHEEKLLIEVSILAKLGKSNDLAIATGRPESETRHVLERYEIGGYFKQVITLDDCLAEEKRRLLNRGEVVRLVKPHPFMLQKIAEHGDHTHRYYVGDMPDDMEAAKNAGFMGVGFVSSAFDKVQQRAILQSCGATFVIESVRELEKILPFTGA